MMKNNARSHPIVKQQADIGWYGALCIQFYSVASKTSGNRTREGQPIINKATKLTNSKMSWDLAL